MSRYDESRTSFTRLKILSEDISLLWSYFHQRFRALFARIIVSLFLRKKAEFKIPGELRMIILRQNVAENVTAFCSLLLVGELLFLVISFAVLRHRNRNASKWAYMIAVPPFLTILAFLWFVWYKRSTYQPLFQSFVPFGHCSHLVPRVGCISSCLRM